MKNFHLLAIPFLFLFCLTSCTKDTGTVTVTYQEATAIYGDLDEIRSTPLNESVRPIENPGKIFIGDALILIGEEGKGVHVIDNSIRSNPVQTSFINIPGNREFFVKGNILYAESYYDMVKIDLSNPNQAILISRAKNAIQDEFKDDNGNSLVGFSYEEKTTTLSVEDDFYNEVTGDQLVYIDFAKNIIPKSAVPASFAGNNADKSGTVNRITKAGDYVYVISNSNMIAIKDKDGAFATDFNRMENIKADMETIFPHAGKLFVGSRSSMTIFNTSDPLHPNEIYAFDHATSCDPVLPYENAAYITLRTADFSDCPGNINALVVLNIENLAKPKQEKEIQMASPYGMTVVNNMLFVGEGENGLKVYDITDRYKPELIKHHKEVAAYDIMPDPDNSNIIFVAGPEGLTQFNLGGDQSLEVESFIAI